MASVIDPGHYIDGVAVAKANLRLDFTAARDEITALQEAVDGLLVLVAAASGIAVPAVEAPVSAGSLTIDLAAGVYFLHPLTENITSIAIVNAVENRIHDFRLRLQQHASSSFTVSWAGTVNGNAATFSWAVAAPTMTATNSRFDMIGLRIYPGNLLTVYGFVEAQGRS